MIGSSETTSVMVKAVLCVLRAGERCFCRSKEVRAIGLFVSGRKRVLVETDRHEDGDEDHEQCQATMMRLVMGRGRSNGGGSRRGFVRKEQYEDSGVFRRLFLPLPFALGLAG